MKKIINMIICLFIVLSIALFIVSCDNKNQKSSSNDTDTSGSSMNDVTSNSSSVSKTSDTSQTSPIGLFKFALSAAGYQEYFGDSLIVDANDAESVLIADPGIFNELNETDKPVMIKYVEKKTGRKLLLKSHDECITLGYGKNSTQGKFIFTSDKYSEFFMSGIKTDDKHYNFTITFLSSSEKAVNKIGCGFTLEETDGVWEVAGEILKIES